MILDTQFFLYFCCLTRFLVHHKSFAQTSILQRFFKKKINIMPVNVVMLAEFELEVMMTLVSKLEAV